MRIVGWIALCLVLVLGACSSSGEDNPRGYKAIVERALTGRDVKVELLGRPPAIQSDDIGHAVTAIMNGNTTFKTNFTTAPGSSANPHYHVVWVFSGPAPPAGFDLCLGRAQPTAIGPGAPITIMASFCRDTDTVIVQQTLIPPSMQGDRKLLDTTIKSLTERLFPPHLEGAPPGTDKGWLGLGL